jgi:hypothetical protein
MHTHHKNNQIILSARCEFMDKLCDENIRINFLSSFPCNIIFYWFLSDTFDECYNNTLVMRLACSKTQMVKSRACSHALHCG